MLDCKTVVFGRFRKARSAVSLALPGRVRRGNDCRLFIQRIRSKRGSYNVTEVTEITSQLHLHLTTVRQSHATFSAKRLGKTNVLVGVSLQTVCKIYQKK